MSYKIIVDIETTGLPIRINGKTCNPSELKYYDSSRMVELAYYIIDKNNTIIKQVENLIKPNNFIISEEVTKIHGISHNKALTEGKPINLILEILEKDLITYNVDIFISHNVEFDKNIILSESYRINNNNLINKLLCMPNFCTMKDNKIFNKWVKLSVLYQELFNKEIVIEHRALSDVKVCYECYNELFNREKLKYMELRNNKKIRKN